MCLCSSAAVAGACLICMFLQIIPLSLARSSAKELTSLQDQVDTYAAAARAAAQQEVSQREVGH